MNEEFIKVLKEFAECKHESLKCEKCRARASIDSWAMEKLAAKDAEIAELQEWHRRGLKIIVDAIMHGMPITEEVAAYRNFAVQFKQPQAVGGGGE